MEKSDIVCKFYQTNSCMKGDRCQFRHEQLSASVAAPRRHPQHQQNLHPVCQPSPHRQPPISSVVKRGICAKFEQTGYCKYGDKCRWEHSPAGHRVQPIAEGRLTGHARTADAQAKPKPMKRRTARLPDVIRYVSSSLPGASFPQPGGVHSFKGYHYRIETGQLLLLDSKDQATVLRRLYVPVSHTAVYSLPPFGLVSYDPVGMQEINLLRHQLDVLCKPDLLPLTSPISVPLPYEDGATKFLMQGATVILFKPYTDVRLDREYFRAISVYRWNAKRQAFDRALYWEKDQFHITSASSTHDYVALSRLPYNPAALEEEMQKKHLHQSHTEMLTTLTRTVTMLESKVQLYEAQAKRQAEAERLEAARKQREAEELLARQQRARAEQYRRADPMDFFVWNKSERQFTRVLEYTKPVDKVLVTRDRKLFVGIHTLVQEGPNQRIMLITHSFDIEIQPVQLASFDWGAQGRVKVDKLADGF